MRNGLLLACVVAVLAVLGLHVTQELVCTNGSGRLTTCARFSMADVAISQGVHLDEHGPIVDWVRRSAVDAEVDPTMLLAVLIRESGDRHYFDWLVDTPFGRIHDFSIGVSNMRRAAFEEAREFAAGGIDYAWESIRVDPERAIRAAAFLLAKRTSQLDSDRAGAITDAEYLRVGYRAGYETMRAAERSGRYEPGTDLFALSYRAAAQRLWSGDAVRPLRGAINGLC